MQNPITSCLMRLFPENSRKWLVLMACWLAGGTPVLAQQWPVQHAPAGKPAPQYTPAVQDVPGQAPIQVPPVLPDFFESNPAPGPGSRPVPPVDWETDPKSVLLPGSAGGTAPVIAVPPGLPADGPSATTQESGLPIVSRFEGGRYPIDPRHPCFPCASQGATGWGLGNQGQPYREPQVGGCCCDQAHPNRHPRASVYWPRPFSSVLGQPATVHEYDPCADSRVRLTNAFDGLASFKLINYQRSDNGYCGRGSDPYGCLGEQRMASRSMDVPMPQGNR